VSGAYSSGDLYTTGITNTGTLDDGVITWVVDAQAPSTLYYVCQFHSAMAGTISVIDPAPTFIDNEDITTASGSAKVLGSEFGQKGALLVVTNLTGEPEPRQGLSIDGDELTYVVASVSGTYVDTTSTMFLTLANNKPESSPADTTFDLRKRYSQIRVTGHDFLNVGTGGIASITIGGGTLINPGTPPVQAQQVGEFDTGRVFSVSTDQDGNFRVGKFFAIDQGTGRATLDASAFDLSGLTSLRLGSIGAQLGEAINEFSSDPLLTQNSNEKVPTQFAIKTYVDTEISNINVNNIVGDLTLEDATETYATTLSVEDTGLNLTGNVVIDGNLTVSGTETILNTETLNIEDKNIVLGNVDTPTDTTADGGGITLKGATDKTLLYDETDDRWESNIPLAVEGDEVVNRKVFTGTLTVAGWAGSGPYTQDITTTGMKADDNPFVDIDMSSINFADVEDRLTDWALIYRGEATADTVTFYATEEPADDIPVKIRR
jgi:hypothetical protein